MAGPGQTLCQGGGEHRAVLDVDQQRQPLGERHRINLGLLQLRGQRIGHGAKAQGVQLLNGWLVHLVSFLRCWIGGADRQW
jgi:hypothetical protein